MKRLRVRRSGPLRGTIRVPGDKSIGHRALVLAALAEGPSTIRNLSGGLDNLATAAALRAMGVGVEVGDSVAHVAGVGLHGLRMPTGVIDCGNSGTTMRLLAGLLVAQQFGTRLVGDASLSRRPMRRVVEPLRARGGHIAGVSGRDGGEVYPPLSVAPLLPGETLLGLEVEMPVASAQVKSALLLSGLYARELTAIREPTLSRDHTERMLAALGVPLETMGPMVVLDPKAFRGGWDAFDWEIPGDLSSAAFVIAAACAVPGSAVTIERVGVNPTRTGFLDVLASMRARVGSMPKGVTEGGEPIADVLAGSGQLAGAHASGELLTRMIDEVPALAALCAVARTPSEIRDAAELRVKESDRLAAMAGVLRAFGATADELDDGLRISARTALHGAEVSSGGDHRVAMAAVVLGLVAEGDTVVDDVDCIDTSFPGFATLLAGLGADIVHEVAP